MDIKPTAEWFQGFPMVTAEAYAQGLPVIASRLGSLAELVEDRVTGLHFNPGDPDDRAAKGRWASDHPAEMASMGRAARRRYEERYTPEVNYAMLMSIYEGAIGRAAGTKCHNDLRSARAGRQVT